MTIMILMIIAFNWKADQIYIYIYIYKYIYIYTYIYIHIFFLFLFFGTMTSTVYESDTYNETQIWRKSRFDKIFTRAEP